MAVGWNKLNLSEFSYLAGALDPPNPPGFPNAIELALQLDPLSRRGQFELLHTEHTKTDIPAQVQVVAWLLLPQASSSSRFHLIFMHI